MTNPSSNNTPAAPICPLATDTDGNPVELPDNAAAWRVRRHTRGRPRIQLGADKQPMQLPLSYTLADLDDILSPGVYRIDLVDGKGEFLGMTKQVIIGQPRNAADDDDEDAAHDNQPSVAFSSADTSLVSDSRFALEASVRSTHLAFQHNQRTLELGLRMAETLRDGVRVLADAQADWIKSISSSRGFFRNAPAMLPAPEPPKQNHDDNDDDDDEEDEDDGEPAQSRGEDWVDKLNPVVAIAVQQIVSAVAARFAGAAPSANTKPTTKFELGDLFNWKRAHERGNAGRTENPPPAPASPSPVPTTPTELLNVLPASLLQKLVQVRELLTADEQQRVMQLIGALGQADIPALVARLEPMSAEQVAEFLRSAIAKAAS